jgi:hypothetical protein
MGCGLRIGEMGEDVNGRSGFALGNQQDCLQKNNGLAGNVFTYESTGGVAKYFEDLRLN